MGHMGPMNRVLRCDVGVSPIANRHSQIANPYSPLSAVDFDFFSISAEVTSRRRRCDR
jgi:hypothetical protein